MKRTIKALDINSAKNEVLNSFMELFLPQASACEAVTENFEPQLAQLQEQHNLFSECLRNHNFSFLTQDLQGDDLRRDKEWSAGRALLLSLMESVDAARRQTAQEIYRIYNSFGKVRQMGYAEQTGAMTSLCSDLLLNHSAQLEQLGLTKLVEDLQASNNAFKSTYEERTLAMSEHIKGETRRISANLCAAYRDLIFLINSHIYRYGISGFETFADFANTLIDQYRLIIGQGASSSSVVIPLPDVPSDSPEQDEEESPSPESPEPESPNPDEGGGDNGGGSENTPVNPWDDPENQPD